MGWGWKVMSLFDMLKQNAERYGMPTKKERFSSGTPMKYFLRPIMEEAMRRRIMEMTQQMPQINGQQSPMVEPPSINPLQNRMMSEAQGGTGGGIAGQQGGAPIGV